MRTQFIALLLMLTLSGCDIIQNRMGIEDPNVTAARAEAEGKAVGGACRHSGRAIEDCYSIYHWLPKASIFAGWQEMDTYMRTNKIESVEPQLPPPAPPVQPGTKRKAKTEDAATTAATDDKAGKAEKTDKPTDKPVETK